ncbi:hypothetical protein HMPREF0299_5298 [Corynebacterium matruchotii ATCC 14266]|uniref:Uncharacterized protein n=1 Tax=Corynebacterium matruchotii ATCC 14266 TaxID=553207 RepID=E0DHY9_9CORY|nr:hypothetical protein HMPREF0299_5298 [Corynebacterium matruchotii ATCC 14266]KAB1926693.1 hypothetical protein F8196_01855 [Corynebacterium matruchotii]QIP46196.1 hypothetical protein HBA49_12285 [Corynebacterium matruchotii]
MGVVSLYAMLHNTPMAIPIITGTLPHNHPPIPVAFHPHNRPPSSVSHVSITLLNTWKAAR